MKGGMKRTRKRFHSFSSFIMLMRILNRLFNYTFNIHGVVLILSRLLMKFMFLHENWSWRSYPPSESKNRKFTINKRVGWKELTYKSLLCDNWKFKFFCFPPGLNWLTINIPYTSCHLHHVLGISFRISEICLSLF